MRYISHQRYDALTRHWTHLWKANVPSRQSLKDHASASTIFVAIDAEPWRLGGMDISEIGITILAPVDGKVDSLLRPTSLEALLENFTFRSLCIRVAGRNPSRDEQFWGGQTTIVDAVDMEDTIIQALESIPPTFSPTASSEKPKLCLIGFDLGFELRLLSSLYPRVLQSFSSWVDLQELVKEMAGPDYSTRPSMSNTLLAFGFKREPPMFRGPKVGHNAGNDTMRIVAVLLNLLTYDSTLQISQSHNPHRRFTANGLYRKHLQDPRSFEGRPKPWEPYPFVARVSLKGHAGPVFSVKRLHDAFSAYNPVAVGSGDLIRNPTFDRGWVCLASLEELDGFVAGVNGRRCDKGVWRGIWEVVSFYDPSLTPARTAEELEEWLKMQSAAAKDQKVLSRKQKREEEADPMDILASTSWGLDEEDSLPEQNNTT